MECSFRRPLILVLLVLWVATGLACASSGEKKAAKERPKKTVLLTTKDDVRVGKEAAKQVEAEIGLLDDPVLTEYVQGLGNKLLRGLPIREFAYKFSIVDQMEPNAFALPGGQIFISRGLLALANNEDELACVIAHEIVHAARRHSAQQQAVARAQGSLTLPWTRAKTMAAYGRDMEREADSLGQKLAAAAGFDPMGMSTFMRRLDQRERLLIGAPRNPTFFDTHPGTRERATTSAMRSRELRWTRDPSVGDTRKVHLEKIDGMVIGDRPESGIFIGELFLHPLLDFEIQFPKGWNVSNSATAVGATAPRRDAIVYLTGDLEEGALIEVADKFAAEAAEEFGVAITDKKKVKLGDLDAVRYSFAGGPVVARMTFFPFAGGTWRIVGATPTAAAGRYLGQILLTTRTFRPLSDEHRAEIRVDRLHVVLARPGEDITALGQRTDNAWPPSVTALINGQFGNEIFEGGELVKILRHESYDPSL